MNLIDSNKGSYKGSFMNNYICKKFMLNQKSNLTNIETNKILNYCKYFLLSQNEYFNLKLYNNKYEHFWFLRSPFYNLVNSFSSVYMDGHVGYYYASYSIGFILYNKKRQKMKIIKIFTNNELLTFTENNKIKIYIDNYRNFNIKKGYKMNLLDNNKGSYKGSFMNNYICKKFISNQKVNLTNIETNKILNCCRYFLLSGNEYYNYFFKYIEYYCYWFLRSPYHITTSNFLLVHTDGIIYSGGAFVSYGFVPFFLKKVKNENNKNF